MKPQLPRFPERALPSKAIFYRSLQDIDVYVEDVGSEVFYSELLKRLMGDSLRIEKVFPLGGRQQVLERAQQYTDSRPALFVVDGDLHGVAGLPVPSYPHLYIHACYCIENYLFCEKATIEVMVENSGELTPEEARERLDWSAFRKRLEDNLVPLFLEFAVAFRLCPSVKTVSRGLGSVLTHKKGSAPEIDPTKAKAVKSEVRREVLASTEESAYLRAKQEVESHMASVGDSMDTVSGKDFLLRAVGIEIGRAGGGSVSRKSLRLRLARHCSLARLGSLRRKLIEMAKR